MLEKKGKGMDQPLISKNDQLNIILESLGEQNDEQLGFIEEVGALEYVRKLQSAKKNGFQLSRKFEKSSMNVTNILTDLLKFNPSQRLSAKQCLASTYFDDIRV